jgi:hypothetical protein
MNNKQLGGINVYRGQFFQRGYGLGSYFSRFFKWLIPLANKHALPVLQNAASTVGREVINSASNIMNDVSKGRNFSEASKEHTESSINTLKNKIENTLEGKGIKRLKKKKIVFVKKLKKDIFD